MQRLPKIVLLLAVVALIGSGTLYVMKRGFPLRLPSFLGQKAKPTPTPRPKAVDPAQAAFSEIAEQADKLVKEQSYGEALAAWGSFPGELLKDKWATDVAKEKKKILDKATLEASRQLKEAEKLAKKGEIEQAAQVFDTVRGYGVPEVSQNAENAQDAVAQEILKKLNAEAEKLAKAHQFDKAIAQFDQFPGSLLSQAWKTRLDNERQKVIAAARSEFDKLVLQADRLRQQGKTQEATDLVKGAASFGLPMTETLIQEQLLRWEEQERLRVASAYDKLLTDSVLPALGKRNFPAAVQTLQAAKDNPEFKSLTDEIDRDLDIAQRMARFVAKASEGAQKLVGQEMAIDGVVVTITKVDKDMMITKPKMSDVTVAKSIPRLSTATLLPLAAEGYGDDKKNYHLDAALLLSYGGEAEAAKPELELAKQAGVDVAPYESRIATQHLDRAEIAATNLYERASASLKEKNWGTAEVYLNLLLKEYRKTKFADSMTDILYDSLVDARQRGLGVANLFPHAQVTQQGEQVALRYDFSNPAQLDDWKQPDKLPWRITGGTLSCARQPGEARTLLWYSVPLPGDKVLEFDASVSEPPRDICAVLDGNGTDPDITFSGYQFYFGGFKDTYTGIQRLDNDSTLKTEPLPQSSRLYHVKAVRAGSLLQLSIDDKLVAELNDPSPLSGKEHEYVALYAAAKSPFAADNLTLTCSPPSDWVTQRLEGLRRRLSFDLRLNNGELVDIFDGKTLNEPWSIDTGVWYTMNDVIVAEGQGEGQKAIINYGKGDWKDYILTAKVNIEDGSVAGLGLRDSGGKRYLGYASARGRAALVGTAKSVDQSAEISLGNWYDLRLQAKGDQLQLWLGETQIASVRDSGLKQGRLALYFTGKKGYFKDVKLQLLRAE